MRAEDIKVGMWVRDPGGDVCKTSRQSEIVRGWHGRDYSAEDLADGREFSVLDEGAPR